MTGTSKKNFDMFRKLCGDDALKNTLIVTNMWGEVDHKAGKAREAKLAKADLFFKPVLDRKARMVRHENTVASAEKIIRLVANNRPLPLRIQEELVKERKTILETSAGEELSRELNVQIKRSREEMRAFEEELRRELQTEILRLGVRIGEFEGESRLPRSTDDESTFGKAKRVLSSEESLSKAEDLIALLLCRLAVGSVLYVLCDMFLFRKPRRS